MAATAGSVAATLQYTLPVAINKGLEHVMAETDPAFDTISTSMGVVKDGWGRNYEIKKAFQAGLAGSVGMEANGRRLYGDPLNSSGLGAAVYGSALAGYMDPRYGPNPEPVLKSITLAAMETSIMFTKAEMDLAALPNQVGSTIPGKMKGWMRNIAQVSAVHFYTADSRFGICTVASVASSGAATTGFKITATITDGNIYRLQRGMQVDAYSASTYIRRNDSQAAAANQTRATRLPLVVGPVDYKNQTAILWMPTATAVGQVDAIVATDTLHIPMSRVDNGTSGTTGWTGFNGINTFLVDSGTLLAGTDGSGTDGIALATFPEYKSLVATASGTATEQYLRKVFSEWQRSFAVFGWGIDSGLTTRGVFNGYLTNKMGSERRDRTSQPLDVSKEGTKSSWRVVHDGIDIEWGLSDYCTTGHMYLTKRAGNNWKRYVPPAPPGLTRKGVDSPPNMEIEFVGPELGWAGNKIPLTDSNGSPQDGFAFYGRLRQQMVPDQIPGVKITGFTEDTLV